MAGIIERILDWMTIFKVRRFSVATEVITRYRPRAVKIKIGEADIKAQVALHFGYWFCADCEVVPIEVWSGGIYHGAGQIDYAMRYFSGKIVSFLPPHPVGIDGMIDGLENGGTWTQQIDGTCGSGQTVGNVILSAGETYTFSLARPPAPPDIEYPENPLLYYLTLSLNFPTAEGWEIV